MRIVSEHWQDWEYVVLFQYLVEIGLPGWSRGQEEWRALSILAGWDEERTKAAYAAAEQMGMITKMEAEEDDAD